MVAGRTTRGTETLRLRGRIALDATQGQTHDFFSQLPYKCHIEEVASVEIDSIFALNSTTGWFECVEEGRVQGYLAHKKQRPPRTLL